MLHSNTTRKRALNKQETERALYLSLYELMNRASTVGDEETAFALASILAQVCHRLAHILRSTPASLLTLCLQQDEHCPILYRAHAHMLLGLWLDAPESIEHAKEAITMLEEDYYDELEADGRLQDFDREQVALAKRILRMAEEKAAAVEKKVEADIGCAGPE
ncbi:unnamed protein product [Zymoseptoria tritici ST99CH_3D1]|uniref:Uncharacterized protein n=1 Tax=Zymoseptoria tritici ST99CH_1E4 TaxID=1276532 RepID=A0A2H1GFL5_ZYMTR|nr:unnamed protein product [Zymoseptoria tritici ST99CH_1E4]SMR53450.1 unnamed protein product [Zymoseptoria tritici ST99CH_3D1]